MTETRQSPKTALVLGGTGAVGRALVRELLLSGAFEKVTTLGRRPVSLEDSGLSEEALRRLEQRVVDFERLDENAEAFNHHDVVFCSLGTTRKQAGSAKAFIRIDQDYVVHAAELAHKAGAKHFSYVSSTGANAKSWFLYPRSKGETENRLRAIGFPRLTILRPAFLVTERKREGPSRPLEELTGWIMPCLARIFGEARLCVPVATVARAMIHDALHPPAENEAVTELDNATILKIGSKQTRSSN